MAKHEKYTEHKTVRLTKTQTEALEQMGVSIREAVEYYIGNNTNTLQKLKQRQRYLSKQIPILEDELNKLEEEFKEVNEKLGHTSDKEQLQIEVITAGDRILKNCELNRYGKTDKTTLTNYMFSSMGKQTLNKVIEEYNIKDPEEFINKVYEYLEL